MKTVSIAAVVLMSVVAGTAMAEGSKIEKSTLINASKNTLTNTQAIGRNSAASTGSINVVGSRIQKSTVINASKNTLTNTQAIGRNSVANTGSVDIR
ncbi:MAG: hypothetical protein KJ725_14160 [Gammaproteobacteria bacterium]|jgi:hypothetical protein|uniref:hypothetical protein n=1 Tax=Methylotuvimicrobium sp. KM1 TaxID=3377707 RepID=UPI001D40BC15|nr:hypothetical protein [Gammaproteobacteria bacterium]